MLTGFSNFVSSAVSAVTGFFTRLSGWFQRITSGVRVEARNGKVAVTFPDYNAMAQEVVGGQPQGVQEVTLPGDKGRQIASQIKQYQIVKKKMSPTQAQELNDNVTKVAAALGMAFESGIVIYLVEEKGLELDSHGLNPISNVKNFFGKSLTRVRDSYVTTGKSTTARESFIQLLQHNIAIMAEQIYEKAMSLMHCKKLKSVQYIGVNHMVSNVVKPDENIAGADMILSCEDGGELQHFSTKYVSNPHSSMAKKSPADVHRLLGGKGARSDEFYAELTARDATPEVAAQHVLLDLWNSLTNGHAVIEKIGQTKAKLDGEWVGKMFSHLFDGDTMTKPAFINYALGQSTVGEFSPAMQRDFRTDRNGRLASKEGAYGEAVLEGFAKYSLATPEGKQPKLAIKIKYVAPGTPSTRGSYIKIYVNAAPEGGERWAKYNVQIQANNLTTK